MRVADAKVHRICGPRICRGCASAWSGRLIATCRVRNWLTVATPSILPRRGGCACVCEGIADVRGFGRDQPSQIVLPAWPRMFRHRLSTVCRMRSSPAWPQRALRDAALETFHPHPPSVHCRYHIHAQGTGGLSRIIERGVKGVEFPCCGFLLFSIWAAASCELIMRRDHSDDPVRRDLSACGCITIAFYVGVHLRGDRMARFEACAAR